MNQRTVLAAALWASLAGACSDEAGSRGTLRIAIDGVPASAGPEATVTGVEVVVTEGTSPAAAVELTLTVSGGGAVEATTKTDAEGRARFDFTTGALPVMNTLVVAAGDARAEAAVDVTEAAPLTSEAFGGLDGALTAQGLAGSTEDLAFDPRPGGRGLVVGADTRLAAVSPEGGVTLIETTGEAFGRVLGLAFDDAGRLYVADSGKKALMRVGTDGVVTVVADKDGDEPFISPNDVAVGPDGAVYLSDSCSGKFLALSADGSVKDRIAFDPATDGGPNGVVVGPDGALWVTTENTALFCQHEVGLTDPLGGLYRIPIASDGTFGPIEAIAKGVGVFGDGLAFDALGNLYAIFDTVDGFALDETIVFVLPRGGSTLRRALAARNKVWANLAFAPAAYGDTTMYLALLAVPPFIPADRRGVERVDVGVSGAPLP